MSIRFILPIALLAAFQNAHAETFIKHKNHGTVVANAPFDMTYERPRQETSLPGFETHASHTSLPAYIPTYNSTKLVLKKDTRYKLGRAVIKYEVSNRKNSMEKIYQRRRTASLM